MGIGGSVTHWIKQLKTGDEGVAQQELWDRYFERFLALVGKQPRGLPQREADEEDVVLSALDCFFDGARRGNETQLHAAAKQMAEAYAILFSILLVAVIAYVAKAGMAKAVQRLSKTKIGAAMRAFLEAKAAKYQHLKAFANKQGDSPKDFESLDPTKGAGSGTPDPPN